MTRPDLSQRLIHFTRGTTPEDAFQTLLKILRERRLEAGDGKVRGGHRCVCFSEAPLGVLSSGLKSPSLYSAYSPFGILVGKEWLYARGGRPVIYQHDREYDLLTTTIQWRHVRYEPPVIDFTWEREWRIQCDGLDINPEVASAVVKNASFQAQLESALRGKSVIIDELLLAMYRDVLDMEHDHAEYYATRTEPTPCEWRVYALDT